MREGGKVVHVKVWLAVQSKRRRRGQRHNTTQDDTRIHTYTLMHLRDSHGWLFMKTCMIFITSAIFIPAVCTPLTHKKANEAIDIVPGPLLSSWMGSLDPILGNATILDMRLPGTHDTLTYDLSDNIADGAIDDYPELSNVLHWLSDIGIVPQFISEFIKRQAQTQVLNVTEQLDNGIRALDLRAMYQRSSKTWMSLHFLESNKPFLGGYSDNLFLFNFPLLIPYRVPLYLFFVGIRFKNA